MKKIVLIVLLVFSALLFVGCDVEQLLTSKVDDKNNTSFIVTDNNEEKANSNSKSTEIGDDDLKVDKTELSEDHLLLESKQAYLDLYIKRNRKDATIDDVWLFNYLGKYNDCIVGVFLDRKNCLFTEEVLTIQIDNLCFYYSYGYEILVYKGGAFYTLYEAYYTSKVLDIIDINYIYKVYNKIEDNNNTENIDTNDDEIKRIETLFTLEEAYKKKYISKNDLLDLHNNIENRVKFELDEDIEQKILNDYLINVKKNFADATDATIDDVSIYGYYGHYNNLYVVRLDNVFVMYPAVMQKLNIDGVVFSYSGPVYMVWLEENNILTTPIDGTYNGKVCYVNPGLSSLRVDRLFEISNAKLSINDKKYEIEECEYDGHFFDNLDLALSYSLDYRQMFEYPNKGWFALLDSSETRKGGYSILISKFNTIYIFETVFDLEKSTYHIFAGYKLTKLNNYTSDSVNSIIGEIDSYDVAWTTWNTMGTIRDIKIDYLKNIDDFQALLREKCIEDNSPVENRKEAYLNFAKEDGSTYGCHIVAILDYDGNYHLKIYTNQSSKKYTIESRELSNKIGDLIFGLSGISKTPTYNFTNDCVLVVVKKEYSEINKVWNLDFFGDLPIKEVKDLTHRDNPDSVSNPSEFKQILKIVLKEPSYEGVLELIEELKKIDEFESAEPNYIGTWD